MPAIIKVYDSEKHRYHEQTKISSAHVYDINLLHAFPLFTELDMETAQEVTGLLARGYDDSTKSFMPTSYASTVNFNHGEQSRIVWMSRGCLLHLQNHPDLYEVVETDEIFNPTE